MSQAQGRVQPRRPAQPGVQGDPKPPGLAPALPQTTKENPTFLVLTMHVYFTIIPNFDLTDVYIYGKEK